MVENAVEHGIRGSIGTPGKICIWVEKEQDIFIKISDSGVQMTDEKIMEMNRSLLIDNTEFGYGVRNSESKNSAVLWRLIRTTVFKNRIEWNRCKYLSSLQ